MPTINLLFKDHYPINDNIHIMIPTVDEVLENEDSYYGQVSLLTAMPIDMMLELDDIGIDYTTINDYDLFLLMFNQLRSDDTSLIFGDLDLSKFEFAENKENGRIVLYDSENDIVIDRGIQGQIAATLRKIHHLEKNRRKPANEEAKKYMLERARTKRKRKRPKTDFSQLESLIIAMVNTEQFKYGFGDVKNLTIYQFNESVRQIIHKVDYEHRMHGIYSGTIDPKNLNKKELNWLTH